MAIRKVPEIQLDSGAIKPIQWNFIDGPRAFALIHGGSEVPRRVHMGSIVRADRQQLHGPSLAARQLMPFESREHPQHSGERLLVIEILDLWSESGRIGRNAILQWPRKIDQFHAFYRTTAMKSFL